MNLPKETDKSLEFNYKACKYTEKNKKFNERDLNVYNNDVNYDEIEKIMHEKYDN